ncbi:MAG: efflux RND transporter periplasmic adaptor subunit [Candidatus Rokubacteria bacterium]|nr:efflux RND transporter periplasmic adaptor subunit [Candidatus Rokubacteria bacterium]
MKTVNPEYRVRNQGLETSGKVQFNEEAVVRIHAPSTGRVVEVLVRPGDVVEPGTRLFVMNSPDLGAAKADYAKAIADVERAEAALRLARELLDVKAIAQKEIREAENDARKARAEQARAASRLGTLGVVEGQLAQVAARADTGTTMVVTAPRGGVVVERNALPGQVVAYGASDTPLNLFVIADLTTMWVVADVYEPDVPRVRTGQTMAVTLPCCPGERIEGRVAHVADAVDKETRTVKVRGVVANPNRMLKAEMFVRVAIATGSARALVIPVSAVHRDGDTVYVLVERARENYERRSVRLGATAEGLVDVLDGLAPSDRVVSTGSVLLRKSVQ